jgi:hypothetical protein
MVRRRNFLFRVSLFSKQILIGALLGLSGLALAFTGTSHPEWIGRTFPNTNELTQQNQLSTNDLSGSAIFTFALPTCGNCGLQISSLASLLDKTSNVKVFVVTSEDSENTRSLIRGVTRAKLLVDAQGVLVKALGLRRVPSSVFVDYKNTIQGYYEGVLDRDETLELGQALASSTVLRRLIAPGSEGAQATKLPGIAWQKAPQSLLVFHGLNCSACAESIPEVLQFAKRNPRVSVLIVTEDAAAKVQKQFGKPLPNLKIVVVKRNQTFSAYGVTGTPTHILVSRDGVITWRSVGYAAGILAKAPLGSSSR